MSQENVAVLRTAFDAYNRRDYDAALEPFHPEVEWHFPSTIGLDFEHLSGADQIRDFWRSLDEVFEGFTLILRELNAISEGVVLAHLRFEGRGRGSGAETEIEWHVVWRFRNGLVFRADHFLERPQALEAAGLSE